MKARAAFWIAVVLGALAVLGYMVGTVVPQLARMM